ncbi:MAG: undecaprenyldiphospho-muramoylpentapeptide beta-N-acetylglucosaminyltransferase [Chloroflexi bacterium]|nr:undecaprenyldiphospho-muramoylpentapeptide beta-N-acetylglucosaminyltransferase [Chloroflexota bacterium]
MRVLATGGGTGGHIYPALTVLEALRSQRRWTVGQEDVAWVGSEVGMERDLVARQGIRYFPVRAGALRGGNPWAFLRGVFDLAVGIVQAGRVLQNFGADVVLATGGFVSAPLIIAAWLRRCPCLIYLPDMEPGLAIRYLSRFARKVAVSFDQVLAHFPAGRAIVTGYPVRQELFHKSKHQARRALELVDDLPVLLVMGGSRGAHSINMAVRGALVELLSQAQMVHLSGRQDYADLANLAEGLPAPLKSRYHLYAYLHEEMIDALAAADLVIARAGAATLAEFPAVGLPAILVPYPYAGQHQDVNARFLVEQGAAVAVADAELSKRLLPTVQTLLQDPTRLAAMSDAARALSRPEAAATIVETLASLAQNKTLQGSKEWTVPSGQ